MKTYLEFKDSKSHKFWQIELSGASFTVQFGKVGTAGQTQEKTFADASAAAKEAEALIKSKTKKGYVQLTAPAGAAPSAPAATKSAAKAKPAAVVEAPVLKARSLPAPGPDVNEDKGRKLSEEEFGASDEDFAFERLRSPEVVDVKPRGERAPAKAPDAPKAAGYDEEAFNEAARALMKAVERGKGESTATLLDKLKRSNPSEEQLHALYEDLARLIFSDDIYYVSLQALDVLPLIVEAGIDIAKICEDVDEDDIKPLLAKLAAVLAEGTGDAAALIDATLNNFFGDIAKIALAQLKEVVTNIKAGKQDRIPGTKLPDDEIGFAISADDPIAINAANSSRRLKSERYNDADDIKGAVFKRYLAPLLKPELEKLLDEGFFDSISHGFIWVGLYNDSESIVERRLDEKALEQKAIELEKNLKILEATDDFVNNAGLYNETVAQYMSLNGIIAHKDSDRILTLIKRFLYSGEEMAEEKSRDLLNRYDGFDYPKWRHTFVTYTWDNMDPEWSMDAMQRLVDSHAYQPAIDSLREWRGEAPEPAAGKKSGDGIDYEDLYGFGQAASMAKHRDTFNESQLFAETDTIIARAFADGYIHIRFKQENEQGYSDALDWLNNLMQAGYSQVHDGYELRVYFLAEPVYFEEMRDLIEEGLWPANDSHAFFCKAVRYPALRDKVSQFAMLTLREFDRYLSLDGEFSTVAGTFAATAAALADVKYMPTAIQYALETDGEHEEMASLFSDILKDYWGVTPETAVAIALLKMSYDHEDLELSDEFWKYPQNLEALGNYFTSARLRNRARKIIRLGNCVFGDAEDGLKKLKKLFKDSGDPKAKGIYANFHNMLLEALEEEDHDDYGKAIDFKAPAASAAKSAAAPAGAFKELPEGQPCLITLAEAKKRGFKDDEFDNEDEAPWCAAIFAPLVITNPYIYDFFEANRKARMEISPLCYTLFNPNMCYTFRKKVAMDLRGAPYQFGMLLFDKKDAVILYGLYDYAKLVSKVGNKKIDRAKLEELREELMFMECPQGSPINDINNPAVKLMDEARSAIFDDRYLRAVKKLERIKPEAGEVYDASLIVMASLMQKKGDKAALKKLYAEAAKRMPQYQAYWDERAK